MTTATKEKEMTCRELVLSKKLDEALSKWAEEEGISWNEKVVRLLRGDLWSENFDRELNFPEY